RAAGEPFVVLFVGNLIERKGVRYLIDAVHRLSRRVPTRLLILGKGEGVERSRLEEQVKSLGLEDRVEMPGRGPGPQLRRDTARAEQLAEAGRQYVEEHFSWPAILEEWQSCYAAAVAAGGKGRVGSGARAAVSG